MNKKRNQINNLVFQWWACDTPSHLSCFFLKFLPFKIQGDLTVMQDTMYVDEVIQNISDNRLHSIALSKIKTFKNNKNLLGRDSWVFCVAALPNGNVISGSLNYNLKVWNINTEACLNTLKGKGKINCIAVLPNEHVISGSNDHTLKVWDTVTGRCLKTLHGHSHWVTCVAVLPNGNIISGSYDHTLKEWDKTTGQCLKTLHGHSHWVTCVAVLPNGNIISGCYDSTLKEWDKTTGECLKTLKRHSSAVNCVAVLPNGQVISGSQDKTLKVCDIATGQCLSTLQGHSGLILSVAILPNGNVISGSSDNTLKVWDIATGQCLSTLQGHSDSVSCITVLPNGKIISGSHDKTLKVWEPFPLNLQEQKGLLQAIEKNTSLIHLDLSNVPLRQLVERVIFLLSSNKNIEILDLRNTEITDEILDKCIPAILSVPLKILNLSDNKLTYGGVRTLFEKLYNSKNRNLSIQKIILSGNLIEVDDMRKLKDLYDIYSRNDRLELIDLSGNLIFSENRQKKLITLFTLLLNKSGLTAGEFLTLRFYSLKKINQNTYSLELKKTSEEIIQLNLSHRNIQDFNHLKEAIKENTDSDVFEYMTIQGIGKRILEIDDDIKNKKYNVLETENEKKLLVKTLIDYHPQAPLKSYINTHSIFCHSIFTEEQSLLCPKEKITHETGRIFLMAKIPKGQLDEHAMLAYEFINGYNQRFFKVAHLTAVSSKKFFGHSTPEISFFVMSIDELVPYLQERFSITSFLVNRKQIKNMHAAIVEDVKELKDTKYKFMISTSSQSKEDSDIKIKNCLTWAWDKIKDHAGYQINVTLSMYPSIAVKWLINNPDKLSMQGKMTVDMIDGKSNVPQQNPNENCLMM